MFVCTNNFPATVLCSSFSTTRTEHSILRLFESKLSVSFWQHFGSKRLYMAPAVTCLVLHAFEAASDTPYLLDRE